MQRTFDIILSLITILILSPILIVICLVLKFTGEGKFFIFNNALDSEEKHSGVLKFVTMVKNSSSIGTGFS